MSEIQVVQLYVFPIKSCGGIAVEKALLTETGLQYDRQFMLVDERGGMVTQRQAGMDEKLVKVRTGLDSYSGAIEGAPNGLITVAIDGFGELGVSSFLPPHRGKDQLEVVQAKVHDDTVEGIAVGAEADKFFSEYLDQPVRLLRTAACVRRRMDPDYDVDGATTTTGFADSNPILLTSLASLRELAAHPLMLAAFPNGIDMLRFRHNVGVDSPDLKPYEEDFWRMLRFAGHVGAHVVKPKKRCPVPNVDQSTGEIDKTVVKVLNKTRRGVSSNGKEKGVFFGQNLRHVFKVGQTIALGDTMTVVEASEEPNVVLAA